MNRVFTFFLAALLFGAATTSAVGAESAPAADRMRVEPLARVALDALPPAPAAVGLIRVTFAPGASQELDVGAFGNVGYVESGALTIRVDGAAARLARAIAAVDLGLAEHRAAADGFTLDAGEDILLPGGTTGSIHNAGDREATLLVGFVGVVEGDPSSREGEAPPAGVTQELRGLDVVGVLPSAPATLTLDRVTLTAGASIPAAADDASTTLVAVESGALTVRADGPITVGRAATGAPEAIGAGTEVAMGAADAAVLAAGARGDIRNGGQEPAVLLIMTLESNATAGNGGAGPTAAMT